MSDVSLMLTGREKCAFMPNLTAVNPRSPIMKTGLQWLWITIVFVLLDQLTKHLAVEYISPYEPIEVMPFFNLVLRYNTGAAFSFLADAGGWQVLFFSTISIVISLGILYWMYTLPAKNSWLSCALALILAGALGNLYDRIMLGKVVDFIDWYIGQHHWPAFNIADSVILLGAVMMLFDGFVSPEKRSSDSNQSKNND